MIYLKIRKQLLFQEKEVSSTSLPVLKTDDQDVRTNDELNSSSHEEKNSAENESYNAKGADSSESSQSETAISIVSVSGSYEDSSENKKEVQEANTENEDHFEVLKLPVTSKIKRYEREKNKPNKKKEPSLKNKIDETVDTETETELIYMLSDNDESTSKNCQNESEECSILQLSSVDDDEQTLQSKEEVKSSATIIKVYSLVESDSDEDMEIALGGRELVAKSDRIEEIVELWDEEEMGVEDLKEEEDIENGVEENQSNDDNIFLNEGLTHEIAEKTNDSFQIHVEENGVLKTHEFYMIKKESNVPSKSSEEIPVSGSKKTTVVPKVFNKCSICKAGFESRSEIKDHMFSKHKDSLDYCTCTVCFKNFSCPNSLKRHSLVHTGTKPYSCEICKRRFSQSSILKRHRFTHNELKPFQCHFCKKSYTQKMNLLIHLRNHGFKGQKEKHKCYLCDKKFVHHSGLSRHLKLHKGEMSFCPLCNKSFTDSSAMLRHVRSIHKQYPVSS